MKKKVIIASVVILQSLCSFHSIAKAAAPLEREIMLGTELDKRMAPIQEFTFEERTAVATPSEAVLPKATPSEAAPSKAVTIKTAPDEVEEVENSEDKGLFTIQIPQRLSIVIDPWELDGRSQIYSEQYVVKNCGDVAGVLCLSNLVCTALEDDVTVWTDKEGLHDSEEKSIYMEMIFENGERIVLSEESSQYEKRLEPEEELLFYFIGEVNENASESWKAEDIAVTAMYAWTLEEELHIGKNEKGVVETQELSETQEARHDEDNVKETFDEVTGVEETIPQTVEILDETQEIETQEPSETQEVEWDRNDNNAEESIDEVTETEETGSKSAGNEDQEFLLDGTENNSEDMMESRSDKDTGELSSAEIDNKKFLEEILENAKGKEGEERNDEK